MHATVRRYEGVDEKITSGEVVAAQTNRTGV